MVTPLRLRKRVADKPAAPTAPTSDTLLRDEDRYVHTVVIYAADGTSKMRRRVYCVERGSALSIGECAACERCTAFPTEPSDPGAHVTCRVTEAREALSRPRMDLAEVAARVRVGEVMGGSAVAVERDVASADVARLFKERRTSAVAVVTADGLLVGVISASDLARAGDGATAFAMMTSRLHTIPESAPIAHAVALMTTERVRQVPVLSDEGELVGVLTDRDALAWIARGFGYVQGGTP